VKINICFKEVEGPWGGGNQFLKYLKKYFLKAGCYEENPLKANVILFNSHHDIQNVAFLRNENKEALFVHRIDGPVSLIRNSSPVDDLRILNYSNNLSDLIIVQSEWSKKKLDKIAKSFNFEIKKPIKLILNTSDPEIFNCKSEAVENNSTIKIVASSWSDNIRKGFEDYLIIDNALEDEKYKNISFDFIGRSPVSFKNINVIKPLNSKDLGLKLKEYNVYITASKKDPCSNALCEAIQSGLFPVVYQDGGHVEICKNYNVPYLSYSDVDNGKHILDSLIKVDLSRKTKNEFKTAHDNYLELFSSILKNGV